MPIRSQKRVKGRQTSKRNLSATRDVAANPVADTEKPKRVAIIGGGCAGVAAAWHLSTVPGFEVSVYERSWRLGGKAASGRAADGRILEHGLHLWLGFYENAFRMIRDCYREVGGRKWGPQHKERESRLAHGSFEDAFFPEPHIGVAGSMSGNTVVWSGLLPPEKGPPGDDLDAETNPFTLANYLLRCVHLLKTLMLSVIGPPSHEAPGGVRPDQRSALDQTVDLDFSLDPTKSPELLIQSIAGRVRDGTLTVAAAVLQAVTIFESVLQDFNHSPHVVGSVLNLLKALAGQARKQLRDFVAIDAKLRWKTEIIDIVMTIAVGLYRDRVLLGRGGLDALNDLDYREWLKKHGATTSSRDSRFIKGIYDLVFAYEGGDRAKPRLAAGVALRGALRMFFTYRGAMFWRMRSGMGDAVFAPLYKVMNLPDRKHPKTGAKLLPVTFHFLHELSDIKFELSPKEARFVTELTFTKPEVRADLLPRSGVGRVENPGNDALDHLGCWPDTAQPLLSSRPVSTEPLVLRVEEHFDFVIFAMGLDDLAKVLNGKDGEKRLHAPDAPSVWREALTPPGKTVATKAAQVWLASDLEQLGWHRGSGIISALELGFDTWADMTHTLATERAWRNAAAQSKKATAKDSADRARSVAYFCGVLPDGEIKKGQHDQVKLKQSPDALLARLSDLWPASPRQVTPIEKHVTANVAGSDRYSLSLPGTIHTRLSPLDRSVLNMVVAGDWTACGLDAGCVEAAVMSGMLAAHAITGKEPTLDSIVGYDHP